MILDKKTINIFRKEFLKIVGDPNKYDHLEQWQKVKNIWVEKFKEIWWERVPPILDKVQGHGEWEKRIREYSARFLSEFRNSPRYSSAYGSTVHKSEMEKWERKIRKSAPSVWKYLNFVVDWYVKTLEVEEDYRTQFEGFTVIVKGYKDAYDPDDVLEKFREVLKVYRDRANSVLPLLLKKQLPLVLDFNTKILDDRGATYNKDYIWVNPYTTGSNLRDWVHTLAHEMGHHIWKTYLSKEDQEFWGRMISGNFGTLDLREVLQKYGNEKSLFFNDRIKKEDPILYLQLQGLYWEDTLDVDRIDSIDKLRDYLDGGGKDKIIVHGKPITGYANKNYEEAFCEALGMLVGYGPRTILEEVREWLRMILPQIKIAINLL